MKDAQVLLVEDAKDMQLIVKAALAEFCPLTCVDNLAQAKLELESGAYSLLLLDVTLPDGNGFEFCRDLRSREDFREFPIIILTGQTDIEPRVLGFQMGADDYVTKPIEPQEFAARVVGKLRRAKKPRTSFRKGDFRVDLVSQKAFLATPDGKEDGLPLTPIEFKLLVHFLRHDGQVFSREELLNALWGNSIHVSGHTVDTHISSLRKKIGHYGIFLRAVIKKGYCFSLKEHAKKPGVAS